jgi:hypothetical protein
MRTTAELNEGTTEEEDARILDDSGTTRTTRSSNQQQIIKRVASVVCMNIEVLAAQLKTPIVFSVTGLDILAGSVGVLSDRVQANSN